MEVSKDNYDSRDSDLSAEERLKYDVDLKVEDNSSGESAVKNFLNPKQCLVYIENRERFADTDGTTYIATKTRDYIRDEILWYDLILDTDIDGNRSINNGTNIITVSADKIVSDRPFQDIEPKEIFHFATQSLSSYIEYPITARSFVIQENKNKPLESTSRSALGSGIYGVYIKDAGNIYSMLSEPNQPVYLFECPDAYPVQDKEHGESLTIASINTNRYMDRIIQSLRDDDTIDYKTALTRIQINENPNLPTLWNIVLYRTIDKITKDSLDDVLANYAVDYLNQFNDDNDLKLVDSINGSLVYELPINYIMRKLGYNGIIASDIYNNGWDRGCVSYDYILNDEFVIITGDTSRY